MPRSREYWRQPIVDGVTEEIRRRISDLMNHTIPIEIWKREWHYHLKQSWLTGGPPSLFFIASATPSTASIPPTTLKFPHRIRALLSQCVDFQPRSVNSRNYSNFIFLFFQASSTQLVRMLRIVTIVARINAFKINLHKFWINTSDFIPLTEHVRIRYLT